MKIEFNKDIDLLKKTQTESEKFNKTNKNISRKPRQQSGSHRKQRTSDGIGSHSKGE